MQSADSLISLCDMLQRWPDTGGYCWQHDYFYPVMIHDLAMSDCDFMAAQLPLMKFLKVISLMQ